MRIMEPIIYIPDKIAAKSDHIFSTNMQFLIEETLRFEGHLNLLEFITTQMSTLINITT